MVFFTSFTKISFAWRAVYRYSIPKKDIFFFILTISLNHIYIPLPKIWEKFSNFSARFNYQILEKHVSRATLLILFPRANTTTSIEQKNSRGFSILRQNTPINTNQSKPMKLIKHATPPQSSHVPLSVSLHTSLYFFLLLPRFKNRPIHYRRRPSYRREWKIVNGEAASER